MDQTEIENKMNTIMDNFFNRIDTLLTKNPTACNKKYIEDNYNKTSKCSPKKYLTLMKFATKSLKSSDNKFIDVIENDGTKFTNTSYNNIETQNTNIYSKHYRQMIVAIQFLKKHILTIMLTNLIKSVLELILLKMMQY